MQQFHRCISVAKVQLQSTCPFLVQNAVLVAVHHEAQNGSPGNCANTIRIAIEVCFNGKIGIENPHIGTK